MFMVGTSGWTCASVRWQGQTSQPTSAQDPQGHEGNGVSVVISFSVMPQRWRSSRRSFSSSANSTSQRASLGGQP